MGEEGDAALAAADEAMRTLDVEAAIVHLSSAVRSFTEHGDRRRAAMACARLGDTYASRLGNLIVARAWFARARRLIAEEPPCVEQGWVAVAAMGCDVDDPQVLWSDAALALDVARSFGDVNLETKALADAGLALVRLGRVADGMAMIDEAMALACGLADDMGNSARSVCSFFTACYHAADFERAGSWADVLRRRGLISTAGSAQVFLSSHCDSVQAQLLIELGRWSDAEAVLLRARDDFVDLLRAPAWHPALGLADLRVLQGRPAEAEALLLGKDQFIEALLPAARLHAARGDHELARACARRGLRAIGTDRVVAASLLTLLVDVELAAGDVAAASEVCTELQSLVAGLGVPSLTARAAGARARLLAATGSRHEAVALVEGAIDAIDVGRLPYVHVTLLAQLARLRRLAGDTVGARRAARHAATALAELDLVLPPADQATIDLLVREPNGAATGPAAPVATLARHGKRWAASCDGATVLLADTKGVRYLAQLIATPGREHHALDLVDRDAGIATARGPDRRRLTDLGPALDATARTAYRRRIEALRAEADDATAAGRFEAAEAAQDELDQLVGQLAAAYGIGGRSRPVGSAVEKARLNVTRALRTAIGALCAGLPGAGAALERGIRTGTYCAYDPAPHERRWLVGAAGSRSFSAN